MRRPSINRRSFLTSGSAALAGLGLSEHVHAEPPPQLLRAPAEAAFRLRHGIGFNWFDPACYGRVGKDAEGYPSCPDLNDRAGWEAVSDALNDLRPGILRFWLNYNECVGETPGAINKQAVTLERLTRLDSWAVKNGCTVMLDTVLIPERFKFPMGPREAEEHKKNEWVSMAPRDNAQYVREFLVPVLKHVLDERRLASVKLFNILNEPLQYGQFATPDNRPDPFAHYVELYRELAAQARHAGLGPDRLHIAGVDAIHPSAFPVYEFLANGKDIDPYLDLYTIHYYFHRFDWMAPTPTGEQTLQESIDRQTTRLARYCASRGKPLLASEVGWFLNDGPSGPRDTLAPSRHHAAMITAETVIRGMNAGLSGAALWSLINPGTFDGAWQTIWIHNGRLGKAQHLYPMYRLLTRYARPDSRVFPLTPEEQEAPWQYVHGTALLTPQSQGVIYLVNDNLVETRSVRLALPGSWSGKRLRRFIKDSARMGSGQGTVEVARDGSLEDRLEPMSLTAYLESSD